MGWRDTIKDAPKGDAPVAKSWRDTIQQSAPVPEEGLLDKLGLNADNLKAAGQTALSFVPDANTVPDFLASQAKNLPIVGPAAEYVGGKVDESLGGKPGEFKAGMDKEAADRAERSPIANTAGVVAGRVAAPATIGANLALSAGDMTARSKLLDQKTEAPLDTGSEAGNFLENLAVEGAAGAIPVLGGKALNSELYEKLAQKFAKKSLGGTKAQLAKFDIGSDALDNATKRSLQEGVFDSPIQSKQDLFDKLSTKRQAAGQEVGDVFANNSKPISKVDAIENLKSKAKSAQDMGDGEIANKLNSEAENLSKISQDELSPDIIKRRKTTLGDQAYGDKLKTDKVAEEAHNTFRDMQEGLVDTDALPALKEANSKFSDLSTAEKFMKNQAAGEATGGGLMANQKKGVGAVIGGTIGGAATHGSPYGFGAGAAIGHYGDKLISNYGNQLGAYGFNRASKVLQNEAWAKTLSDAAERGGPSGVATAHFLLTQRDPEYRQTHQSDQDAGKDQ